MGQLAKRQASTFHRDLDDNDGLWSQATAGAPQKRARHAVPYTRARRKEFPPALRLEMDARFDGRGTRKVSAPGSKLQRIQLGHQVPDGRFFSSDGGSNGSRGKPPRYPPR